MIDISDGLAKDLRLVLDASHCGATLVEQSIPRSLDMQGVPCSVERALSDGEDFELCFTVSPEDSARLQKDTSYPGGRLHNIGTITSSLGFRFDNGTDIARGGYVHGRKN
jgi:thiamine-monophosphate kinase